MRKGILILLVAFSTKTVVSQDFNKSMVEIMKNMKDYTLEMVDKMPEDKFDYRPTDSVRTFRVQVRHIIATNHLLLNYYLTGNKQEGNLEEAAKESFAYADKTKKEDLMSLLAEQFNMVISFYEKATEEEYKKTYMLLTRDNDFEEKDYYTLSMLIRDHFAHHRSQLIVYLRMNDIKPAEYRGF